MEIVITGPNDILWELQSELPENSVVTDATDTNLNMGTAPWLGIDANTLKHFAKRIYDILSVFSKSRPNAEITMNGITIKLGNISEQLIETAIDKAIESEKNRSNTKL